MLTVQEFPSALSVPTTLAARPLSARSLLRTLRLALRDGGGRAGTGSASPSITLAFASASRLAISSSIASMARSICSSVIALTPPVCSTWSSRGTSKAHIFMYATGCCLRTFSIAAAPCFLKSAASASRKSLLNDLRVASKDPPGLLTHFFNRGRPVLFEVGSEREQKMESPPYRGAKHDRLFSSARKLDA